MEKRICSVTMVCLCLLHVLPIRCLDTTCQIYGNTSFMIYLIFNVMKNSLKLNLKLKLIFQPGLGDDGGRLNPFQKIFVFYRAPFVKYVGTCISYLIFLLLYSYVILFGFRYEYQIPELVVYGKKNIFQNSLYLVSPKYKILISSTL